MGKRIRKPTEEDIAYHLEGLNHVSRRKVRRHEAAIAKAIAIDDYLQWFRMFRVPIHKDAQSHLWKLGWPPDF